MCKRIFKNETLATGQIPFYKIGTFGKTPNAFISKKRFNEYRKKFSFPKKGDVLLSASGTIGRRVIYNGEPAYFQDSNIIWIDNDESKVLNKFLYYFYSIVTWQTEGGTIKRLYNDNLKKIKIPIPPLAVQKEIVKILDNFAELEAELEARKKQYEYYREELLSPLDAKLSNGVNDGVEWVTLSKVCEIGDGLHGTPNYNNSGDYYFTNGNNLKNGRILFDSKTKRVDESVYKKYGLPFTAEKTIFMSINGTIGSVAFFNNESIVLGKSVAYLNIKSKLVETKYISYFLCTHYAKEYYFQTATGATIKNLGLKSLRKFKIPIPPLSEQKRIVSILDKFNALVNDISTGLPAEIAARKKQYEYYRNRLLTFKPLEGI